MLSNRNSKISQKENLLYRVKRKFHERELTNSAFQTNVNNYNNVLRKHSKFKIDKNKYEDNIDFIKVYPKSYPTELVNYSRHNNKLNNFTLQNQEITTKIECNQGKFDMELEKKRIEKHYSTQNNYLNKMMFNK